MTINGTNVNIFHARVLNYDILPAKSTTRSDWPEQSLNFIDYGNKDTYKEIDIQFLIKDSSRAACEIDKSNLCAAIKSSVIKFSDCDLLFKVLLDDAPSDEYINNTRMRLKVKLSASFGFLEEISKTLSGTSDTIAASGNEPSPATVKITPSQDIGTLILSGLSDSPITINNLHAGNEVTIDGENCCVTENDLSQSITESLGSGKWIFRKYAMTSIFDPDTSHCPITPVKSMIPEGYYIQQLLTDKADLFEGGGDDYLASFTTAVYVNSAKTITFCFLHDDGVNVFVDGVSKFAINTAEQDTGALPGKANFTVSLTAGAWHTIEILLVQHFGRDGIWNFSPTLSSQVDNLNCSYAPKVAGTVNKFPDCDMSEFPTVKPGNNSVSVDKSSCSVTINYKPKFM